MLGLLQKQVSHKRGNIGEATMQNEHTPLLVIQCLIALFLKVIFVMLQIKISCSVREVPVIVWSQMEQPREGGGVVVGLRHTSRTSMSSSGLSPKQLSPGHLLPPTTPGPPPPLGTSRMSIHACLSLPGLQSLYHRSRAYLQTTHSTLACNRKL